MPKSSGKRNNNFCYGNYETLNSVDRFCGKLSKILSSILSSIHVNGKFTQDTSSRHVFSYMQTLHF